jgi:hypothetical protein
MLRHVLDTGRMPDGGPGRRGLPPIERFAIVTGFRKEQFGCRNQAGAIVDKVESICHMAQDKRSLAGLKMDVERQITQRKWRNVETGACSIVKPPGRPINLIQHHGRAPPAPIGALHVYGWHDAADISLGFALRGGAQGAVA